MPEPHAPILAADQATAPGRNPLAGRLDEAFGRFAETLTLLEASAAAMRSRGLPPDFKLIQALGDCHREFLRVRHETLTALAAGGRTAPAAAQVVDLVTLRELIGASAYVEDATTAFVAPEAEAPSPMIVETAGIIGLQAADRAAGHSGSGAEIVEAPPPPIVDHPAEPEPPAAVEPGETVMAFADPFPDLDDKDAAFVEPGEPAAPSLYDDTDPYGVETLPAAPPVQDELGEGLTAPGEPHPAEVLRGSAVAVLKNMLSVRTRDGDEVPALTECLAGASALLQTIESAPPDALPDEARSLAEGTHPLNSLVTSVRGDESLTDAQWAELHATVTQAYGRSIAIAVARHRLVFATGE